MHISSELNEVESSKITQKEILSLVHSNTETDIEIVRTYLEQVASSFSPAEAFSLIAYVDTPDVLG